MHEVGFIRADMDVRFITVAAAEDVLSAILAAAAPRDEAAAEAVAEKF
jgi:hypothetical protein